MKVSFKKLWVLCAEKEMSKAELRKQAGLSSATFTRLRKNEEVTLFYRTFMPNNHVRTPSALSTDTKNITKHPHPADKPAPCNAYSIKIKFLTGNQEKTHVTHGRS